MAPGYTFVGSTPIRWATDRLQQRGIVAFVTNGYFIDGTSEDGLRACLEEEFTSLYIFNLRGNARTSGEQRRMEKGNVFGEGSRTPIAISILVKNPEKTVSQIFYCDIGDYLSQEEKLSIIDGFGSITGIGTAGRWERLTPNGSHDWINQRNPAFEKFISIGDKKDGDARVIFSNYSRGLSTSRDAWCYNFSKSAVGENMNELIAFYRGQLKAFTAVAARVPKEKLLETAAAFADKDPKKISWSRGLLTDLSKLTERTFSDALIRPAIYRPLTKQWVYFDRALNDMVYQIHRLFPTPRHENRAICVTSVGNRIGFSAIMCDSIPDLHMVDGSGASQCFPLYLYAKPDEQQEGQDEMDLAEGELTDGYLKSETITDDALGEFRTAYGSNVFKEDIFYYVYGVVYSPEYRSRFGSDLKKMLPRIPLTSEKADFRRFAKAGRELAELHVNYEAVDPWPIREHRTGLGLNPDSELAVQKLSFGRKDKLVDKTVINVNAQISLINVPLEAYNFVVNGKSAIEWVIESYQVRVDKDSGIRDDPNDWAKEQKYSSFVLDLLKRIIRVSMETLKIIKNLPALNERKS